MKVRPCPAALHGPSSWTLPAGRLDPCGVNSELLPRNEELWKFVLLVKCKQQSNARLGVYLTVLPADVFVPLGPFNNSGSASRWHWFRKSQTWFIQEVLALSISPLPFFASYFLLYSYIFFITFIVLHVNRRLPTADYIFWEQEHIH